MNKFWRIEVYYEIDEKTSCVVFQYESINLKEIDSLLWQNRYEWRLPCCNDCFCPDSNMVAFVTDPNGDEYYID